MKRKKPQSLRWQTPSEELQRSTLEQYQMFISKESKKKQRMWQLQISLILMAW